MNFCIVHDFATCSLSRYVCCFSMLHSWRPLLHTDLVAIELLSVSFLLSSFAQRSTEIPALEIWLQFRLLCLHLVDDKLHIHRSVILLARDLGKNDTEQSIRTIRCDPSRKSRDLILQKNHVTIFDVRL